MCVWEGRCGGLYMFVCVFVCGKLLVQQGHSHCFTYVRTYVCTLYVGYIIHLGSVHEIVKVSTPNTRV